MLSIIDFLTLLKPLLKSYKDCGFLSLMSIVFIAFNLQLNLSIMLLLMLSQLKSFFLFLLIIKVNLIGINKSL